MNKLHNNIHEELESFAKTKQKGTWSGHLRAMFASDFIPLTTFGVLLLVVETLLLLGAVVVLSGGGETIRYLRVRVFSLSQKS